MLIPMRKIPIIALVAGVLLSSFAVRGQEDQANSFWPGLKKPAATDETSTRIIDLHLAARGGEKAMKAVQSLRLKGKVFEGNDSYRIEALFRHGGSARFETFYDRRGDEHRTVKATDGTKPWQRKILPKIERPTKIGGEEGRLFDLEARLPFLLLDHAEQQHVFLYTGKKEYLERTAYVIHGWLASGLRIDIYFDSKSFQILNYRHLFKIAGRDMLINLTPSKLKRKEKVWWEMEYKANYNGKTFRRVTYERIRTNLELEDALFAQPEIRELWLRGSPR